MPVAQILGIMISCESFIVYVRRKIKWKVIKRRWA